MSSKLIILLLCLTRLSIQAQDTLCKRSGECIAARILEVGINDVRFKRSDNPDGPLFVYNKNDIKSIKYANGHVDTFALVQEQPKPIMQRQAYTPGPDYNLVQPTSRPGVFVYQGRVISDNKLIQIASAQNERWKDKQLDAEIDQTKNAKGLQYGIGYGGLGVCLGSLILIGELSSTYNNNTGAQAAVSITGIGLFVASQVVSYHFKLQRGRHARRMAELYNADNQR